jgi:ankyrin repeat protein
MTYRTVRFRWVVCQLEALRKCQSPAALEKALGCLPKTLYETYDRILLNIDEEYKRDALSLLQWLAFSVNALSLSEVVDILATDPDTEHGPLFDQNRRLWNPRDILTICSSLITITVTDVRSQDEDNGVPEDPLVHRARLAETEEVRLAHFSVREYLVSEHLSQGDSKLSYYHFKQKLADTFIAKTCVAYLLQFNKHNCIDENTHTSYPLSSYAARYWITHTQPDNDEDAMLLRLIMELLLPGDAVYSNWLELWNPDARWDHDRDVMKCPPIYYMSMAGLERVSRSLLTNGSDPNGRHGRHGSALQAASYHGKDAVVRLLLEVGVDIDARGGEYGNALQAASYEGHEMVVQLLLERGVDMNAKGGLYCNALQAASWRGHEVIVRLLLEWGSDINTQGGLYGSALLAALSSGSDAVVHLLLENGADINAEGGAALEAASDSGNETLVRLVLEKGADVNGQGSMDGDALEAGSQAGNDAVLRLLLDRGADVNAQGYRGGALQMASRFGHESSVRLLLERGSDVNAQGCCD